MLDLPDDWVWDFWLAEEGSRTWAFFLHAPRSLGDPDLRHEHARIGLAHTDDLRTWTRVGDPLPQREGFDDLAQWTGCTVRHAGRWWLFTTGRTRRDGGRVQRISAAVSTDLRRWRHENWLVEADPRWYDVPDAAAVDWRDPWVVRDDTGLWHLYATARTGGPGSGVVAHATSRDLRSWRVGRPLSVADGRFAWLEVIQLVQVEGRWVMVFNCLSPEMPGAEPGSGGVWTVPVAGPGAPVDLADAVRLTDETRYVGKVVRDRRGDWQLLAFRNSDAEGRFVGGVADPVPVRWRADGSGLELVSGAVRDRSLR